jgi:hypothetical protein
MTLNYGVGYDSAEKYFKEIIFKIDKKELNKEFLND